MEVDKNIASMYDEMMIKEKFNMKYADYMKLRDGIVNIGGHISIAGEMTRIDIPYDKLECLSVDGNKDLSNRASKYYRPWIPPVVDIQVHNNKVVIVKFADGSFTKCVFGEEDGREFDLYSGVAFCLFKRFLGKDGHKRFNDLMRAAMAVPECNKEHEKRKKELKAEERLKEAKKKAKKERKKARKATEKVELLAEALLKLKAKLTEQAPEIVSDEKEVENEGN